MIQSLNTSQLGNIMSFMEIRINAKYNLTTIMERIMEHCGGGNLWHAQASILRK